MKKMMNNIVLKLVMCTGLVCNMGFAMEQKQDQGKKLKNRRSKQQQRGLYQTDDRRPNQLINDKDLGGREVCVGCCLAMTFMAAMVCSIDARASYYEQLGNQ